MNNINLFSNLNNTNFLENKKNIEIIENLTEINSDTLNDNRTKEVFTYSNLNKGSSITALDIVEMNKSNFIRNMDEVKQLLNEVIKESYPELKDANISFKSLEGDSFYFQSNFKALSLLKKDFEYVIQVNQSSFQKDCPKSAVKAILAHELSHTLDYEKGGNIGILKVGLKLIAKNSREKYEHKTDLKAILLGYGSGLIEYRNWVYKNIPSESLSEKKETYYQPEEIKLIMENLTKADEIGKKDVLIEKWLKNPPKNKKDIELIL